MKKIVVLFVIFLVVLFTSCPLGHYPLHQVLDVSIDKREINLGEKIELEANVDRVFYENETSFIVYIENYPTEYNILKGTFCESLSTEKYLCIFPEQVKTYNGTIKVQFTFPVLGIYTIKVNGASASLLEKEMQGLWNEDFYTYTIVVKE